MDILGTGTFTGCRPQDDHTPPGRRCALPGLERRLAHRPPLGSDNGTAARHGTVPRREVGAAASLGAHDGDGRSPGWGVGKLLAAPPTNWVLVNPLVQHPTTASRRTSREQWNHTAQLACYTASTGIAVSALWLPTSAIAASVLFRNRGCVYEAASTRLRRCDGRSQNLESARRREEVFLTRAHEPWTNHCNLPKSPHQFRIYIDRIRTNRPALALDRETEATAL